VVGIVIALGLILGIYYGLKRKNKNLDVVWLNSTEMYNVYPGSSQTMQNQMGPLLISPFSDVSGVWTVNNGQVVIQPYQNGATNQQWYFYSAGGPWEGGIYPSYIGTDLGNVIVTTGNGTIPLTVAPVTTSTVDSIANPAISDSGAGRTSDCEGYLFFDGSASTGTSKTQYYLLPIENTPGTTVTSQATLPQPTECHSFAIIYFGTLPSTQVTSVTQN
jgi:hypothetical protein